MDDQAFREGCRGIYERFGWSWPVENETLSVAKVLENLSMEIDQLKTDHKDELRHAIGND